MSMSRQEKRLMDQILVLQQEVEKLQNESNQLQEKKTKKKPRGTIT